MRIELDSTLLWFFQDSARELGFHASPMTSEPHSNVPTQKWPSAAQCHAAAKQTKVRAALRQLSGRLQAILECAYEARPMSIEDKYKYDLAAPLVARVLLRMKRASKAEQEQLKALVLNTGPMLESAHAAFRIAYGPSEASGKVARRRARVDRWLADEGLMATA